PALIGHKFIVEESDSEGRKAKDTFIGLFPLKNSLILLQSSPIRCKVVGSSKRSKDFGVFHFLINEAIKHPVSKFVAGELEKVSRALSERGIYPKSVGLAETQYNYPFMEIERQDLDFNKSPDYYSL
ncbi:MAG: hypothetical protein NT030_00775, partial [Candidatus Saganbacteria bacterium]|nr:hypothetical protein [Candidatus Saganbacteria bacterium]